MRVSKVLGAMVLVVACTLASAAHAPSASATVTVTLRGVAVCNSGRSVVGIYIESSSGGDGWASFTPRPAKPSNVYYSRTFSFSAASTVAYPTVGCGGTAASWASSSSAPGRTISATYVYNVVCIDPASGNGTCSYAPYPSYGSSNPGYSKQCTWGAAEMWKKATGHYPSWNGNAKDWNDNAKLKGFRVMTTPQERSIAVWEPNVGGAGANGHVAWVSGISSVSSSTIYFTVREMNWPVGAGWATRKVKYTSGMSFIVAPPGPPITS